MAAVHIIIVSHNSTEVLPRCLAAVSNQLRQAASCIVVDSGSDFPEAHREICRRSGVVTEFLAGENRGFAAANNRGFARLLGLPGLLEVNDDREEFVLFLNPDAFLQKDNLEKICSLFARFPEAGAIGGTLLGYDQQQDRPSGLVDSTGIFRRWYGRWYDRGQGEKEQPRHGCEQVPALCGAMMACRLAALRQGAETGEVFDERFFLYKEDIELGFRLRHHGWQLYYCPELRAFHCRGWARQRRAMAYRLRLMAAENELRLYRKYPSPYILWAFLKYLLVRIVRV